MSDPYSPERRAHDLALMRDPSGWPNNPFFLKRWLPDIQKMENGILYYKGGWFRFKDDFGLEKTGGADLCDKLVKEGWLAD